MALKERQLADSPALQWMVDEASGSTITDTSGNSRNGTVSGGTAGSAGILAEVLKSGQGGASGQGYGSIASAAWMDFTTAMSAEVVYKAANVSINRGIFSRYAAASGAWLIWNNSSTNLSFLMHDTTDHQCATSLTTFANMLYHLVGTYDGANMTFYINGGAVNQVALTTSMGSAGVPVELGGYLGSNYTSGLYAAAAYYPGKTLSAAAIAERALLAGFVAGSNRAQSAHMGTNAAGRFTVSRPIIVTGCYAYSPPNAAGPGSGVKIGICPDFSGTSSPPWLTYGLTTTSYASGLCMPITFNAPVLLVPGQVYCFTQDYADAGVYSGGSDLATGALLSNLGLVSGSTYNTPSSTFKIPFQLIGAPLVPSVVSPSINQIAAITRRALM